MSLSYPVTRGILCRKPTDEPWKNIKMVRYEKQEVAGCELSAPKTTTDSTLRSKNAFRDRTNSHRVTDKSIHKSETVIKRKEELEELERRSLTTDIATQMKNAEAPIVANPDVFTECERENIRMEKEKLREAKTFLNNYQADGNELDNVAKKQRRKSLDLEKAKLREARRYLNKYRADGNELDNATQKQRRRSLEVEREKVQEARNYMNSYRAESNGIFQTSCPNRTHSTGKKAVRSPSHVNVDAKAVSPKQLFIPNKPFTTNAVIPMTKADNHHSSFVGGCSNVEDDKQQEGAIDRPTIGENNDDSVDSTEEFLEALLGLESSLQFKQMEDQISIVTAGSNSSDDDSTNLMISEIFARADPNNPYNDSDNDETDLQGQDCFVCTIM